MEKYSNQITDYLYKDMSDLQREAFEERLKSNAKLAAEVERQKTILASIQGSLVYNEAMEDPYLDEAERLADEAIQKRGKGEFKTIKLNKSHIIYRLVLMAATITLLFLINRFSFGLNPVSSILKQSRKSFVSLWKMLR